MNQPQTVYAIRDVAKMLGVSRSLVVKQVATKQLRSHRVINAQGREWGHLIHRSELVRWLLTGKFDLRHLRMMLNRAADANVALVRTRPGLQSAVMGHDRAIRVDSLFGLGRLLGEWRIWAVVVDLAEVGALEATRSLSAMSKQVDRPELIGLYDDEYAARPETAEVFDLLLPLSRSDAGIASAIAELKP